MEDPLVRSYLSEKGKENWEKPHYIKKQNAAWTEARKENLRKRNRSPEILAKIRNKATTEERLIGYFFESFDIDVLREYVIGHYVFDIYLPSIKILIEFDGLRFHHEDYIKIGEQRNLSRDKAKTTYIKKYHPELTLIRFNETSLYQRGFLEYRFKDLVVLVDFSFSDVEIREVDDTEALLLLTLFQYKENQRAARGLKVGAYLNDKLIGIAVYSSVGRKDVATSLGYTLKDILEMSRFCIHPSYLKTDFGSWFLARSREYTYTRYPYILGIVSFVDTLLDDSHHRYNAGYKFIADSPEDGNGDYHYKHNQTNKLMHKLTLSGIAKKMREPESIFAAKHGFEKIWGVKKLKTFYAFPLKYPS